MGRFILLMLAIGSLAWSQSILEHAGIAAGSTAGSIAGKQVSNGITNVLNKAGNQAETVAKGSKEDVPGPPLLQVGPGMPKQQPYKQQPYNVPDPPPLPQEKHVAPRPRPEPVIEVVELPPPPPPPPPMMTAANLATVTQGMRRSQVLEMGRNAVHIMTTQNGHVEESLHYRDATNALGVVRLVDGTVARVDIQP